MKNFTNRAGLITLMTIMAFLSGAFVAYGQTIQLNDQGTQLKILTNEYTNLSLENTVSELKAFNVKSSEGDFSQIRIDGYGYSMEIGSPKLPVIKKLIEIPLQSNIEITITSQSYKDYNLADIGIKHRIFPAQPSVPKNITDPSQIPFEIDQIVYGTDALQGGKLVKVVELGIMRGVKMARLEIAPVLYNPVKNMIRVYENIQVEISFKDANVAETIALKESKTNRYFKGIGQLLYNYKPLPNRELIQDSPVTMIIVSDPMFEAPLQPFIQWKTKKGFKVVEAYTDDPNVGTTTTSIKNYLKDFYENPPDGYNPQSFVLIVGDVDQVPTFNGTAGGHVTDLYYCEYTNDIFPEAFYGRFSANNLSQLQPQIDKTLEYEQYLFPDPSFLNYVVMVAGADASHSSTWGNGQINYGTEYYFNEEHGIYSYTYLQPEPGGGNYSQNIHQNISDGVTFANYTAHCSPSGWADPSFVISDIPSLTNDHKYPLMIGNCCSSVEFQTTCFGEEILRAANKGALGYIGGSNSTLWDEDYWWGVGFESVSANPPYNYDHLGAYDRLFHDREGFTLDDWYITQDQVVSGGNLAVTQSGSSNETYYWEIYHLMGDPSLMNYYSEPPDATANYAGLMPLGSLTFTVTTDPYSYVAISKDGVLYGTGMADESGMAEITFDPPISVPGQADVVITGQNKKPYIGTVLVASPEGAYVLLDDYEINDANGNNNGMADYGETFSLDVSMKNLGQDPGTNVTLTLSSDDDYLTINNNSANLGDIEPDEVVTLADVFGLTLAEDVPDMYGIPCTIDATDGNDVWTSSFSIKAHAPVLEFVDFSISDPTGNNNGKIDPGETAEITLLIKNTGSADAYNVICDLTTSSTFLTISTDPQTIGDISPNETGTATFEVTASETTPAGQIVSLNVAINADMGITAEGEFNVVIGQIPVLIVDLDENNNSASYIYDAIDELGVSSEITTSFPDDLNLYSSIFVCLGIYSDNYVLTAEEGQLLADYLDNGGMLYMEGGDTWYYDNQTAVHAMFGINGTEDGSGDLSTIEGVTGTMTEGMTFNYTGDNNWIDHLEATGTGVLIFNNTNPLYGCAVSNDAGGYKTVGASFEFGGLSSTDNQVDLMEQYLEFFEILNPGTMNCNATADPEEICEEESSQLNAQVSGGSGNYTYQWTPETGLSDPTIQNPVATPEETTTYTVTVTDQVSSEQTTDQITVIVNEKPETPTITQVGDSLISSSPTGNQWYDDNGMIPGATNQIYAPGQTGNYYTIVTNVYGCSSEPSNVVFFQPMNIEEYQFEESINIYPNPASENVTVEYLAYNSKEVTISLYNAYGQKIHDYIQSNLLRSGDKHTVRFNVSGLPSGIYYFKIEGESFSVTRKIILGK